MQVLSQWHPVTLRNRQPKKLSYIWVGDTCLGSIPLEEGGNCLNIIQRCPRERFQNLESVLHSSEPPHRLQQFANTSAEEPADESDPYFRFQASEDERVEKKLGLQWTIVRRSDVEPTALVKGERVILRFSVLWLDPCHGISDNCTDGSRLSRLFRQLVWRVCRTSFFQLATYLHVLAKLIEGK